MKLCILSLAALVALFVPVVVQADTVYYSQPGSNGIQSISGTIVKETGSLLEVTMEDGKTVSISKANVFQIVRGTPATTEHSGYADFGGATQAPGRIYHAGIKGGMNISNVSVDPQELEDGNSLQSYAVGAWWGIPLNRRLTIQTEAFYSVKGDAETSDGYTSSTRMGYIDVPVLAKIGFLHDSTTQPSLFLGPLMAVNLTATSKLEGNGSEVDMDIKSQVRKLDFGLVVGGGVDFLMGERSVGVDLRYSKGLRNIAGETANGTGHHDVIAVMGSIGFQ